MEVQVNQPVKANAKTLSLHLKVCDRFSAELKTDLGDTLKEYGGYVPGFMPGEHYGDYLILDIDIDTGTITNWRKPTPQELQDFIASDND